MAVAADSSRRNRVMDTPMERSCFTPARLLAAVIVRRNKYLRDESERLTFSERHLPPIL